MQVIKTVVNLNAFCQVCICTDATVKSGTETENILGIKDSVLQNDTKQGC